MATPSSQLQGYNQQQALLQLTPGLMHHGLQQNIQQSFRSPYLNGVPQNLSLKTSPVASTQLTPQASPAAVTSQIELGPLSASVPPEAQQFIHPDYFFQINMPELKKGVSNSSAVQGQGKIAVKEEPTPEKKCEETEQEPEQLETPADSSSGASVASIPDLSEDSATSNNFSPETFSPVGNTDMMSSNYNSSTEKSIPSLVIPHEHSIPPQDISGLAGFDDIYNFDGNLDWMLHDWNQDTYTYQ